MPGRRHRWPIPSLACCWHPNRLDVIAFAERFATSVCHFVILLCVRFETLALTAKRLQAESVTCLVLST